MHRRAPHGEIRATESFHFFFSFLKIIAFISFTFGCSGPSRSCAGSSQQRGLHSSCVWASPCGGFSCCGARASAVAARGLSGCGSWALHTGSIVVAHGLGGVWDLPGPGITPASLASAGRFFTAESPEKPRSVGTPRGWGNIVPSPSESTRTSFQGTARKVGRVALLGTPGATRQAGGQGLPPQPEAMLPANTSDAAWEGRPAPVLLPPNLPLQS